MKFLSQEWFSAMCNNLNVLFATESDLNFTYCEVFEDCPGEEEDIWIWFDVRNGLVAQSRYGKGQSPAAELKNTGKYSAFVKVAKGELTPKMSILTGAIKLQGSKLKAFSILGPYDKFNKAKIVPDIEF